MSQLNDKSFNVVNSMIKQGYKVVGKWNGGVVLQNGNEVQIVPSNIQSQTAVEVKSSGCEKSNVKLQGNEELFKLYKEDLASEKQIKSVAKTRDTGRTL